jgi:leucyl aminopeptidase (aminopeptidase T)
MFKTLALKSAILPGPTAAKPDIITTLAAQLAAEDEQVAQARKTSDDLALSAADGSASPADADRAHEALQAAIGRRNRTARTLQAAQTRAAAQAKTAARDAREAVLSHCITLAKKRAKAADITQEAVQRLADAYSEQNKAEVALAIALPTALTTAQRDFLYLEADDLMTGITRELDRVQAFGTPPPWREDAPFAIKYHDAAAVMRERYAPLLGLTP